MFFRKLFIKEPLNLKCRHKELTFLGNMKCLFIIRIIRPERVVCDFLAHGIIAVELKAINYLEAYDLDSNKKIKIIQESNE